MNKYLYQRTMLVLSRVQLNTQTGFLEQNLIYLNDWLVFFPGIHKDAGLQIHASEPLGAECGLGEPSCPPWVVLRFEASAQAQRALAPLPSYPGPRQAFRCSAMWLFLGFGFVFSPYRLSVSVSGLVFLCLVFSNCSRFGGNVLSHSVRFAAPLTCRFLPSHVRVGGRCVNMKSISKWETGTYRLGLIWPRNV